MINAVRIYEGKETLCQQTSFEGTPSMDLQALIFFHENSNGKHFLKRDLTL